LKSASPGEILYTGMTDKTIQAYASRYGVKVQTKRLIAVNINSDCVTRLTQVHVVSPANNHPQATYLPKTNDPAQ
jgi:hypothetical protein